MSIWLIILLLIAGGIVGGLLVYFVLQYLIGKAFMDSM